MKRLSILSLIILSISIVGCTENKKVELEEFLGDDSEYSALVIQPENIIHKKEESNEESFYNENFIEEEDSSKIFAMYYGLDENKYRLTYDYIDEGNYYYEYEEGMAVSGGLNSVSSINDKKYQQILRSFSFPAVVMPANIVYSEVIKLVEKVLPDDIAKQSEKINTESGNIYIYYSSSKGNFLVELSGQRYNPNYYNETDKDDWNIYGIQYFKEI